MSEWKKVKIGDFLKRKRIPVQLEADKDYKLITIKLYHKGVFLRCNKKGSEIHSNMYKVSKDDFILSGIDTKGLLQAVDTAVEMVKAEKNGGAIPVPDYTDINVSDKVVKLIQSYVGVVNKMVWRKDV